jgi:hypothetical protein
MEPCRNVTKYGSKHLVSVIESSSVEEDIHTLMLFLSLFEISAKTHPAENYLPHRQGRSFFGS